MVPLEPYKRAFSHSLEFPLRFLIKMNIHTRRHGWMEKNLYDIYTRGYIDF